MKSRMPSTTINIFLIFSIFPLLSFVGAINGSNFEPSSFQCPPPPPCICNPTPVLPPPPSTQPSPSPSPNAQPLTPPPTTLQPPPTTEPLPPPPQTTPATTFPPLPQTTPPPPPNATPPLSPPSGGICSRNDTELQICANTLRTADSNLDTGKAEPCCSIIRNLSDIDAVTCLCKSVGAKPFSLSPNINILFRTCGRRIPQGFSCPGPSPTTQPLPPNSQPPPPPQTAPSPPPTTTPPPSLEITPPLSPPSGGICSRDDTELQICANILRTADSNLNTGRAEPCCSIIRNLSDIDAVTCLCKSVGAKPSSLSPNINILFRTCGRRIPQGFSCPGPSPTTAPLPPNSQPPPPPPATTLPPPPPPNATPPLSPPSGGICSRNDTELQICANILRTADSNLNTGKAEPCCSIIRNLSDIDAVTCLCKSVGAKPSSLSPNINILFRTCGRRIPQGFSCPGPSPTTPPLPPNSQPPPPPRTTPSPPPTTTPPPPLEITPPLSPPSGGICSRDDTELQICANILRTADSNLNTGRAEPCCSIIRNLSDIDAITCLCKSVGAKPSSLSPNINILFRTCGRRIPQGFSCPGPSPTTPPLPPNSQPPPPPQTAPSPPPTTTPPPLPEITPPLSPPSGGICSRNDTELQICANILRTADSNLNTGRAEPCCSIIRNLSDIDAVTCLCKSVGAKPSSLSPNINILFRTCGRKIPQGFSCPGPSPTTPPLPPNSQPPPPPPATTLPPPPNATPPLSPPSGGICSRNDTELQICANILRTADSNLSTGRAEPCCSIIRNLSDIDAVTCLCKSVGAKRFSLSPNINIFFKTCGRRIPQGFSCP